MIEFLLDQNTTLASIAQQSIVTVAAGLADTPKESEKYQFHQYLLNHEIFEGIILGLMDIVNNGNDQEEQDGENKTHDKSATTAVGSVTSTVVKQYDDGGINLAKMVCLMVK